MPENTKPTISKTQRETVKTFAIIFLAILVVLTFFSNTIMNYTLPECATDYAQSMAITARLRLQGTVDMGEPYAIKATDKRTVERIMVHEGDTVNEGDVLLMLEPGDSKDLTEAKTKLDEVQSAYDNAIIAAAKDTETIAAIRSGELPSLDSYLTQLAAVSKTEENALANKNKYQDALNDTTLQISLMDNTKPNLTIEYNELKSLNNKLAVIKDEITLLKLDEDSIKDSLARIQAKYDKEIADDVAAGGSGVASSTTENRLKRAQDAYDYAVDKRKSKEKDAALMQIEINKAQREYDDKSNSGGNSDSNAGGSVPSGPNDPIKDYLNLQKVQLEASLKDATAAYDLAKSNKSDKAAGITALIAVSDKLSALEKQKQTVADLEKKAGEHEIKAPVMGYVATISKKLGEITAADETIISIMPQSNKPVLNIPVTVTQAKKVRPGDVAELQWNWGREDTKITLTAIRNDPAKPNDGRILVFTIDGNATAGEQLTINVGSENTYYDMVVPTSAIREDAKGKFILKIESKNSPLGNRYIARRVEVTIIEQDDTRSAIRATMDPYEHIITTSNKLVTDGQQVRLAGN